MFPSFPKAFLTIILTTAMLVSCVKDDKKDDKKDDNTELVKQEAIVEKYFNEMNDFSDQAAEKNNLLGGRLSSDEALLTAECATITINISPEVSPDNPDTLIIDFGAGCTGNDGNTRAGRIIVSATGKYRETGTVLTIVSDGYSVNGNRVFGYRKVTNLGPNNQHQPAAGIEVDGSIALANNGGTITWKANRVLTWTEGHGTPLLLADDQFTLTGTSAGTGPNGESWTTDIISPLLYKRICHQLVSGTMSLKPAGHYERLIDFGSGNCDNTLQVTINGLVYTIVVA